MLVEDVLEVRLVLVEVLVRAGFTVAEASNGQEAVVKAQSLRPDAIVLDVSLPILDGVSAARAIRAAEHTRDVPLIALTGLLDGAFDERSFDVVLRKPCAVESLIHQVRAVLTRAAPGRRGQGPR